MNLTQKLGKRGRFAKVSYYRPVSLARISHEKFILDLVEFTKCRKI